MTHLTTGKPVETCLKAPNPLRLWNGPTEIWNLNSKKNRTMVDKLPQLGCSHQIVALNQVSHQLLRGMVVRNAGCCWVVYPKK